MNAGTLKLMIVSSVTPPIGGMPNADSGRYPPAGELLGAMATVGGCAAARTLVNDRLLPLCVALTTLPLTSWSWLLFNVSVMDTVAGVNSVFVTVIWHAVAVFCGN